MWRKAKAYSVHNRASVGAKSTNERRNFSQISGGSPFYWKKSVFRLRGTLKVGGARIVVR
jgi:hypothetical protein